MSAVWALFQRGGPPVDQADLQRMGEALAAWGDAPSLWFEGQVGLGYRCLAFTPEDRFERQPLLSHDHQRVMIVDGRLDNRPELARDLGLSPAEARELPDSAFVLRAYERWGAACPNHLIGALAFIAWDCLTKTLFAASTPGNKRTLFYVHTDQLLAVATVPRGLLALPCVSRELNEGKLAEFMLYEHTLPAETFYRNVRRLPSGHLLTADARRLDVSRYWQPERCQPIRFASDQDYVEAFRSLFERVVADHLRSLSPIAAMLSGGLDSSSVAATAAPLLESRGQRLSGYTEVPAPGTALVALPGRYNDETEFVQAIAAQHANLDPHWVRTDGQWFVAELPAFFSYHEAPLHATANLVWLQSILRAASERGEKVVLVGDFGNLSSSWAGDGLLADYVRHGRVRTAWREARALAGAGQSRSAPRALWARGILPLLPQFVQLEYERLRHPHTSRCFSPIREDFAQAQGRSTAAAWKNFAYQPVPPGPQARIDAALRRTDSVKTAWSGQFGVDVRDPTADQRLIEFCLAIPPDQYLHDGQPRWLIRRALAGRLPAAVLWNRKRGYQAADWFERLTARRSEVDALLRQFARDDLVRRVLDLDQLQRLVARWPVSLGGSQATYLDYYRILQDGLMIGCYLSWYQSGGEA